MSVTTDTAAARADVERVIEGRTVADALAATVERYGDRPAYSDKADGRAEWRTFTWQQMYDAARDVAAALVDAGVEPGRTVAIMATNRIEHLVADMGAMLAGAVPMSIYNTLSPDQIAFIAGQARPAAVFVETADHLERWRTTLTEQDGIIAVVGHRRRPPRRSPLRHVGRVRGPRCGRPPRRRRLAHRRAHRGQHRHDPLHVGHHRRPQGRRAQPSQRALRLRGRPADHRAGAHHPERLLPPLRPHRRADPEPLQPAALRRQPHVPRGRPVPPARGSGRGAPRGVLRRAPGVGEDPVGPLGAAGDGARRRQEGRDRERHAGRHGVRRVAPGRAHHLAGAPGAVRRGERRRARPDQGDARPRPGGLGGVGLGADAAWRWPASSPGSGCRSTTSGA